ncbi:MAG: VWA domain-containing protein [Deltaproteobacteria bacterium]|nr:VWA domain-containing protein [Deltaproteobacteria bacterium]
MARKHIAWGQVLGVVLATAVAACGPSGNAGPGGDGGKHDGAAGDGQGDTDAPVYDGQAGTDGIQGCDPKAFTLQQSPPAEVYLVIDRSGSMKELGSNPALTKWQELNAAVSPVLTQFDGAIHFGILTYPTDAECGVTGPQVKFGPHNRGAIMTHLTAQTPAGGTPTAAALNNASSSLRALGTTGAQKLVILATDGGPNCNYFLSATPYCVCGLANAQYCCTNYPSTCFFGQNCLDDTHVLEVIADLRTAGIDTVVIGLAGSGTYASLLDQMAVAGGRPNAGSTYYYATTNQAELEAALQTIAVSVISCEIDLQEAPDIPDGVKVYMDGVEVQRDTTQQSGWDYADGTHMKIKLFGAACQTLQDGQKHEVIATFPCVVY